MQITSCGEMFISDDCDCITSAAAAAATINWQHGVMASDIGLINEVNQHRARLAEL